MIDRNERSESDVIFESFFSQGPIPDMPGFPVQLHDNVL